MQDTIHEEDASPAGQAAASPKRPKTSRSRSRSGHTAELEQELRTALGTKVEVRSSAAGRGKIVIHFANADEFERLSEHFTLHQPSQQGQLAPARFMAAALWRTSRRRRPGQLAFSSPECKIMR